MKETYKISELKANPNNPRIIRDDKFKKLVNSIQSFPQMMEKRKLVCVTDVDGKLYPLGGNMRLKAIEAAGHKEIPRSWVDLADDWTAEQRREFVIKDNVGYGEWDHEQLANEWDSEELQEWGLDLPGFDMDTEGLGEGFNLKDGDKEPFQQMTFTFADEQATIVKNAIEEIKRTDEYKFAETMGNENSNGNALYLIVTSWAGRRI